MQLAKKVVHLYMNSQNDLPVAGAGAPGRTEGQRNAWKLEAHSSLTVPITTLCEFKSFWS